MPANTDKDRLKQYFRSGSRPTQKQFHELIDSCYNTRETFTSFVSGYALLADQGPLTSLRRREGSTLLVPAFDRINMPHTRLYHYPVPVSNIGVNFILEKLVLDIKLPGNARYTVKDGNKEVNISQTVNIESIRIYDGTTELFSVVPDQKQTGPDYEFQVSKAAGYLQGISIDIAIAYHITSDIAVSDKLDITTQSSLLEHTFGSAGCIFIPREQV